METWSIVLISISVVAFFSLLSRNFSKNLPPSPPAFPIIGHLLWLLKPYAEMELILRNLHEKYGPIFTLYIGRKPLIFIATRSLAHEALVQNSAILTDRPPIAPTTKIFTCNQHSISFGSYDPKWRLLRRNITSEILCLPRIRSYSHARKWAWKFLLIIRNSEFLAKTWKDFVSKALAGGITEVPVENKEDELVVSYVDTLLDLQIPEENNRKLTESEVTSLCAEFLDAGTGSTSTAFQWIMANLVKYPEVQEKLFMEMKKVIGDGKEELSEEEVERVPYLKAVILEGFRRHPPAHNLLAHAATEDTVLNGFVVPKGVAVNFLVAEMGLDPKAWKDPMAFKPERFLDQGQVVYDITGSKEIKMLPFGAGRRMCAGYNLGILHLEYFVGNLVWKFQWKAMEGDGDVNFAEEDEFTIPMKYSLQANISPRVRRE
ncbi:hypothetical protein JRO89_XS04G0059100 [Xanthoceras sorbifolium]|uniref:Cytochrome P450 n=1 Tax=Xanthoceras sorbifolium TaxID=99658 RepID=A0ABQ8I4C5_9ROSI|nr:hypothetical protein JRO89_XS04G0059100 [Xanthoceras sorbifolium]